MTDEELTRRLELLDPENREQAVALARALTAEGREAARAAVRLWRQGTPEVSQKAAAVLAGMGETAVRPLLEAPAPAAPRDRVLLARLAAEAVFGLERRIFARFYNLYQDGREVPPPEDAAEAETAMPAYRVCDEAYVLLRELVSFRESRLQFRMNADAFLNLPEEMKNAEIGKARDLMEFSPLVEDVEEED